MTKFILILISVTGMPTTAEFDDEQACMHAKAVIEQGFRTARDIWCFPKSTTAKDDR